MISSDFCHWGKDFRYTYYNNKFKTVWESTEDLDNQALNIIGEMNSKKFKYPVITSVKKFMERSNNKVLKEMLEKDIFATDVYTLGYEYKSPANLDYTNRLIVM